MIEGGPGRAARPADLPRRRRDAAAALPHPAAAGRRPCATRCAAAPARQRRDPLAAGRRPLRLVLEARVGGADAAVADAARASSTPTAWRRSASSTSVRADRRRRRTSAATPARITLLRIERRVAASGRQPGPAQLDDPARRHRRRRARRWLADGGRIAMVRGRRARRRRRLDAPLRRPRERRDRAGGGAGAQARARRPLGLRHQRRDLARPGARATCRRRRRCATAPATPSTSCSSSASIPSRARPGRRPAPGLQSRAAGRRWRRRRIRHAHALQLGQLRGRRLRHSRHGPRRPRASPRREPRGGFEIVDKFAQEGHLHRGRDGRDASRPASRR